MKMQTLKTAKRIAVPVALLASATLVFAGCANPDDTPADEATSAGSEGPKAPTGLEPGFDADPELAALVPDSYKEGSVVVAVNPDVPPVKFVNEKGEITGLTVQLVTGAAQVLGLEAQMERSAFDALIPGLTSKRHDIILSMGDFAERQEEVDFIDYMTQESAITVSPDAEELQDLTPGTLCGLRVGFTTGTKEDGIIEEQSAKCVADGKDEIQGTPYGETAAAFLALASGQADAVFADATPAYYNQLLEPERYKIVYTEFVGPYGIAFRKDEEGQQLREAFHQAMLKLEEDGWYEELMTSWGMQDAALPEFPINGGKSIDG